MLQSNLNQSELQSCYQIIQNQRQTGANYVVTLKQQQQNYTKKSNDRKPFMPTFPLTGSMESAINLNPISKKVWGPLLCSIQLGTKTPKAPPTPSVYSWIHKSTASVLQQALEVQNQCQI